jgi:hypothetical protein
MGELIDGEPLFPGENLIDQLDVIQNVLGNIPDKMKALIKVFYHYLIYFLAFFIPSFFLHLIFLY